MQLSWRIGIAAMAFVAACSKSSGPDDPETTYTLQVTAAPPATAAVNSTIPISFTLMQSTDGGAPTPASGRTITFTVSAGGGTIDNAASTTITTGTSGVVSLTWKLGANPGVNTLRATATDMTPIDVSVTATAVSATQLAITTQPATTVVTGAVLSPQPVVQLRNAAGAAVAQSGIAVVATVVSGPAVIGGTTTANTDASGNATFTNLTLTGPGTSTVRFTATLGGTSATVTSDNVIVTALPATQLAITTQPATTVGTGSVLSRQPVVQLRNAAGTAVAQAGVAVVATIATGPSTIGGTTTATTDANGNATFTNLTLTGTGTSTLRFTSTLAGTAVSVTSDNVAVTAPNQLGLTVAPTGILSAVPFFQQPTIQLQNGAGAPVLQAGVVVTVSTPTITAVLGIAPGGTGSLTATTDANGVAAFHDLMLTGSGNATLTFSAPGFTTVSSAALSLDLASPIVVLNNGPVPAPITGVAGALSYYTFTAPAGTTDLSFATLEGTGNVELYARRGTWPTASDYTCRDLAAGITHLCDITSNRDGAWFVIVRGAGAFAGVTLRGYAYGANCTPRTIVTDAPISGTLNGTCTVNSVSRVMDRFTWVVGANTAVRFNMQNGAFGEYLDVKRLNEARIFIPFGSGNLTSSVHLFPPGTYQLEVMDALYALPQAPAYTLTINSVVPPAPVGCSLMTAHMSGLIIPLSLTAGDCAGTTVGTQSHRISVLLGPGQALTVSAASSAFDPYIKIMAGQITAGAPILAEDDNGGGGTTARLTYMNPGTLAFFTVEVSSKLPGGLGAYTFTYDASGAFYNGPWGAMLKKP